MIAIRRGVFETNSSSTHSICICTQEEYDKWSDGSMIYDSYDECLVPITEEVIKEMDEDPYRYNKFDDEENLEPYEVKFTTPSGDKMVAFGWYGYDG